RARADPLHGDLQERGDDDDARGEENAFPLVGEKEQQDGEEIEQESHANPPRTGTSAVSYTRVEKRAKRRKTTIIPGKNEPVLRHPSGQSAAATDQARRRDPSQWRRDRLSHRLLLRARLPG